MIHRTPKPPGDVSLAAGPNSGQTTTEVGNPIGFVTTQSGVRFFVTSEDRKPAYRPRSSSGPAAGRRELCRILGDGGGQAAR